MKETLFLIFIFCISCSSYSQNVEDEVLVWSSKDSLKWSDFKGIPDSLHHTFNNRYAKAISAVGMEFVNADTIIGDNQCYKLIATFYPKESWCLRNSKALLNHERGHFNLAEIYARKLRKKLLLRMKYHEQFKLDIELDSIFLELNSMSKEYDNSTVFGTYQVGQSLWNEKIKNELKELEAYSADSVICICD